MDFKTSVKATIKIEQFLNDRDWCIDGELTRIIERTNREIAKLQEDAIRNIVLKLEQCEQEARTWANNEMTDIDGNVEKISKREQQKSATDVRHIRIAIDKISCA